jgi:CheY-like chemotaxis protein
MTRAVESVLLVDDNPSDNLLHRIVLDRAGVLDEDAIWECHDGQEALEFLTQSQQERPERFPPTLILLDINMPRMNGFEFLERLRDSVSADWDSVIIVILTSSSWSGDRERAMGNALVDGFAEKPLTVEGAQALLERYGLVGAKP